MSLSNLRKEYPQPKSTFDFDRILAFHSLTRRQRYSNGLTEGFNNKIKLIQRIAYGLRNEHNRRKRILAWCGRV